MWQGTEFTDSVPFVYIFSLLSDINTGEMKYNLPFGLILALLFSANDILMADQDPESFIMPRFTNIKVTSAVKFADVKDYKGQELALLLDIYQPEGDTSTDRPVIIWIHGGGFRSGSMRTQNYIVKYAEAFARRGYVCISIDYRLRDGSDMPDRESEYPALQDAARDANTAIDWVRENAGRYGIDPDLLFIAGGSAGGRAAVTVSQFPGPDTGAKSQPETKYRTTPWNKNGVIASAILWGAPEPEMRGWVYPYLSRKGIPTVMIHGEADSTISVKNSIDLDNALREAGITSELHIIPGAPHTPSNRNNDPLIEDWIARFFAKEWNASTKLAHERLTELNQSISRERRGEIIIRAKRGAKVTVEQVRHEFWFGCAISNSIASTRMPENDLKQYKEKFLQNFNSAVTENAVKWGDMEKQKGEVVYLTIDAILKWTESNGIPVRGHNLFWGIPQFVQPWVKALDDEDLRKTLQNRAETVTRRYRGRFVEYDLNNEMIHGNYYEDRLGPDITKQMAQWARNGDPDVKLWLNDYDILTGNRLADYMLQIRSLLKQGVPIAGIGVQGHLHGQTFDRVQLQNALDSLAIFNLPVRVTEFNIPGQRSYFYRDKINVMTAEEEQIKAKELVDYYRICFAHPAVEGILMWGFWEGANWIPVSSLYRRDWTPTPAAEAYRNLIFKEWRTSVSGSAGKGGTFSIPAFYGKYRVTVNGVTKDVYLSKDEGRVTVDFRK